MQIIIDSVSPLFPLLVCFPLETNYDEAKGMNNSEVADTAFVFARLYSVCR
ncbi:hypothetical protein [Saccharococcus thermophilus]|uniref:Uncharacterized protein n=1 Tax=Saccharococcus thermophilus TaxID=29396 RepID=A0A846MIG0_9BACL|nr:hypothetical protein [Saccharococcus thermophilus]